MPPDANPLDPQFADPMALMPVPPAARGERGRNNVIRNVQLRENADHFVFEDEAMFNIDDMNFEPAAQPVRRLPQRQSLLKRISKLPPPVKKFLLDLIEKRHVEFSTPESERQMDWSLISEDSLIAEIDIIRSNDTTDYAPEEVVNDDIIAAIIAEILRRDSDDIFTEYAEEMSRGEDTEFLDLNQPLMQLFLRTLLPWNQMAPSG